MRIQLTSLAAALLLACGVSAQAGPIITYDFTGTVGGVTDGAHFKTNGTIPLGTSATGSFTYEAGSLPAFPVLPEETDYSEVSSIAFSLNIGGGILTWDSGPLSGFVSVTNDATTPLNDEFFIFASQVPPVGLSLPAGATIATPSGVVGLVDFLDFTATALTSQAIPTSIDLSKFTAKQFTFTGSNSDLVLGGEIEIGLDSLTLRPELGASVPEPGTFESAGIGIALLAAWRWRRRTCGQAA